MAASMEPPGEHGGVASALGIVAAFPTLQWSRRVNTAECTKMGQALDALGLLQWSRRVNTAECRAR